MGIKLAKREFADLVKRNRGALLGGSLIFMLLSVICCLALLFRSAPGQLMSAVQNYGYTDVVVAKNAGRRKRKAANNQYIYAGSQHGVFRFVSDVQC